jgi:hypothetical protein
MKYTNTNFKLNQGAQACFERQGFLKLNSLFSLEFIEYLINRVDKQINTPVDKYQTGFNRIAFDLFDKDPVFMSFLKDRIFAETMFEVTQRQLFYTQGIGFELKKDKSTGFPWHVGTQSFGYQRAEDFGCTIWIPLAQIDSKRQRGGMAYVPKNIISGKFMYEDIDPAIVECLKGRVDRGEKIKLEDYTELRDGPLNETSMEQLLNFFAIEDDFRLGDALLFDKYVIHRSVKLEQGLINERSAFAMRFIETSSKYDLIRAQSLEFSRNYFHYSGPTKFHLEVCKKDGDRIAESSYFFSKENRLVNKT